MTATTTPPSSATTTTDLIDDLVGIAPGSPLDIVRRSRDVARTQVQAAEEALFEHGGAEVTLRDRLLVGAFATALITPRGPLTSYRLGRLSASDRALVEALVGSALQEGPWGTYREPGLVSESVPGTPWVVPAAYRGSVDELLAAVLAHTHLLVFHPRDSRVAALEALVAAGWTRSAIVTWSQLVSFVAFQARLVAGLIVLAGEER